jgi:hypothetical protein
VLREDKQVAFDQVGKLLLIVGGAILVLGLVFLLLGRSGFLGKLPGDISFTSGNFTCFVPLASMILLSLLLTIIANVLLRIFNK